MSRLLFFVKGHSGSLVVLILFGAIIDDGIGMDAEDATLAFERHATSKLKEVNDGAAWESMISRVPMGYAGKPSDVGDLVAFLASDEAAYITSEVINCGGGMIV